MKFRKTECRVQTAKEYHFGYLSYAIPKPLNPFPHRIPHKTTQVCGLVPPLLALISSTLLRSASNFLLSSPSASFLFSLVWNL